MTNGLHYDIYCMTAISIAVNNYAKCVDSGMPHFALLK